MATHVRESITFDDLADTCDAITAAIEGDPKTAHLVLPWVALTTRGDALAASQHKLDRIFRRVRTSILVQDAIFDPEIGAFGRRTVDDSNGKRDIPPYSRFFSE